MTNTKRYNNKCMKKNYGLYCPPMTLHLLNLVYGQYMETATISLDSGSDHSKLHSPEHTYIHVSQLKHL